jgi:hypothetical protein
MSEAPSISVARYAKGMAAVRCPSGDGYKTRAMCLCEALRGRYSGREGAYIMSQTKAAKLAKLYAEGWNANFVSRALIPPTPGGG